MNKLEMAQRFAEILLVGGLKGEWDLNNSEAFIGVASDAWKLADAMQKEWDERNHVGSSNEVDSEWQPDWSQAAPEWANHLVMTLAGTSYWFESTPWISGNGWIAKGKSQLAFCDMYHKGDWRESLRSRP